MASLDDGRGATFTMVRSLRLLLPVVALLFLISLWYVNLHSRILSFSNSHIDLSTASPPSSRAFTSNEFPTIKNSTLGFERVFLLNLPERTDKLDAFTLSSSLHSFTFDVVNGVRGGLIQNKTLPTLDGLPVKQSDRHNILGAWRAHLNVAQLIVRERVSTAIVFEDDSDWDINLRTQLEQFAQGSRHITSSWSTPPILKSKVNGDKAYSPYGDDWDFLWLGHCGVGLHPAESHKFIVSNDPTVPSPQRRVNYQDVPDMSGFSNSTRLVFRAGSGVCLYAYALSYRGAQKMLLIQSSITKFQPIDIGIRDMCGGPDFKCVGVFPQIIDSHKAVGGMDRDSDITEFDRMAIRSRGYTNNIVRSTRLNWGPLLAGQTERVQAQYPEDTPGTLGDVSMRIG